MVIFRVEPEHNFLRFFGKFFCRSLRSKSAMDTANTPGSDETSTQSSASSSSFAACGATALKGQTEGRTLLGPRKERTCIIQNVTLKADFKWTPFGAVRPLKSQPQLT